MRERYVLEEGSGGTAWGTEQLEWCGLKGGRTENESQLWSTTS